jgi:hypothetical protein
VGLARAYIKVADPAWDNTIVPLLTDCEPDVAQQFALELFAKGALPQHFSNILKSREIPSNFRKKTPEEMEALFAIDLDDEDGTDDHEPVDGKE